VKLQNAFCFLTGEYAKCCCASTVGVLPPLGAGANDSTSSGEAKPRSTPTAHLARAGKSESAKLTLEVPS